MWHRPAPRFDGVRWATTAAAQATAAPGERGVVSPPTGVRPDGPRAAPDRPGDTDQGRARSRPGRRGHGRRHGTGEAPDAGPPRWDPPRLWRFLLVTARIILMPLCRLRVTGAPPASGPPLILAANHIGALDPVVLMAACRIRRITPRIMATGGLFRAPVLGAVMRHCGQIRVDRRRAEVIAALPAARAALDEGSVLLAYPEGRITLDPGGWPERGRTGLARLARDAGAPVIPVAQWGAHLLAPWGAPRGLPRRLLWALTHRPVVRVHFGEPLDLTGARIPEATDRIMAAVAGHLVTLRPDEPALPAWIDPNRPLSTARSRRGPALTGPGDSSEGQVGRR
jgi:1-acyl-sn-glycerol-3-phosphate acyltransferase